MKTEAEEVAETIEREEMARSIQALSRTIASLTSKLEKLERRFDGMDAKTDDLEDSLEDLESGGGDGPVVSKEEFADLDGEPAPHAYKVITTPDGKVLVLLPKDPDGSYFPAAQGGKHLGSSGGVTADEHAGPYPAGGQGSSSDEPAPWARYGWYELSGTLDVSGSETNDKLVVAKFSVPRDPPESQRTSGTEVQGPQLTEVSLVDSSGWKSHASQTWKEFDASGTEPVTREVAIAHLANGLVTQLTMTPFISLCNGTGDDWHPDSECEKFLSLDPMNEHACPDYETEEYEDTELRNVGKDLNGNPIMREVTVTKTRIKTDPQTGEPIQKTDGSGNPLYLEPKHQVHNFESGNDGGDTTYDAEYNRTEELVAVRVPKEGGGAELFWRHVKFSQDAPCPPVIDVTEPVRSGNYVVFYVDVYEGAKVGGVCTSGQRIQHKEVAIPIINPELSLQEKCVITGVQVGSGGITFQRESVLCVAGSGTCQPVTIEAEACENA